MNGVELVQSAADKGSMIILAGVASGIIFGCLLGFLYSHVKKTDICSVLVILIIVTYIFTCSGETFADHIQNDEYQGNLDTLNRHYDISIIDKSDKHVYGKDPTNIDFLDSNNKLHHGTLIMKGNTATIYVGSGSEQTEYKTK